MRDGPTFWVSPNRSRVKSKPKPVTTAECKIGRWMRSRYSVSSPFRQCWCATPSKAVAIGLFCCSPERALSARPMGSFKALGRLGWSRRSGQWSPLRAGGPRENLDHRRSTPEVIPNRHNFPCRIGIPLRLRGPIARPPATRTGRDQGAHRARGARSGEYLGMEPAHCFKATRTHSVPRAPLR
jgi:hypothetical protein